MQASGLETPAPWTVLAKKTRNMNRKKRDVLTIFPGAFGRDGYHIANDKKPEYEKKLAEFLELKMEVWESVSTAAGLGSARMTGMTGI